jgi:hypothetical protein
MLLHHNGAARSMKAGRVTVRRADRVSHPRQWLLANACALLTTQYE